MRPKENLRPQSHKTRNSLLHKRLALPSSHCLNHSDKGVRKPCPRNLEQGPYHSRNSCKTVFCEPVMTTCHLAFAPLRRLSEVRRGAYRIPLRRQASSSLLGTRQFAPNCLSILLNCSIFAGVSSFDSEGYSAQKMISL